MGDSCAIINDDNVQTLNEELRKTVLAKLRGLNVDTNGLTKEETIAVISRIMTDKGYTQDTVMNLITLQNRGLLNDAVAQARIEKMQEKQALESNKIGDATFTVGEKFKKNSPRKERDTIFIFADNLQASNEVFGEQIGDTIEVSDGTKLNVRSTSALVRTDSNGDPNPNAVGLVIKKNAQNENGVFIDEEGYFQDNDKDFDAFVAANQRALDRIKELLEGKDHKYTKISMVSSLATEKAALPRRFAEKLAEMLEKELGIFTQLVPNGKGFGLKVMKLGKQKKTKEQDKKKEAVEAATKKLDDLFKSLNSERPKLDSIEVDPNDRSLLAQVYPSIELRMARVAFISERFSKYLTDIVDGLREKYEQMESRNEQQEEYYQGLTKGTREQQRTFALGTFTVNGESLGSYILNKIKSDLEMIAAAGATEEGIASLANHLLAKGESELHKDFMEELAAKGYDLTPEQVRRYAFARARYLTEEYAKMVNNPEVFNALCRDAAIELTFSENIILSFRALPVKENESTDENMDEGAKENANKEGYMIKYKLLDPASTLSVEVKRLLGSLYKRDSNGNFVFTDLGSRVKMSPLVAYKILLDEFSSMRSPDQFEAILDEAIEKYPWLGSLRDVIVYNPEKPELFDKRLRNQFFTAVRKAEVPHGMISADGLLVRLNRETSSEALLENVRANYEGRITMGSHPIYTEDGDINVDNCIAIHKLFVPYDKSEKITGSDAESRRKKRYANYKKQPFDWARKELKGFLNGGSTVENVKKAISILYGSSEDHPGISLENTLKCIGIDTTKLDIDSLFGELVLLEEEELDDIRTLDGLSEWLSSKQVSRLINILVSVETIVNQKSNQRLQPGDNLVKKYENAYLSLGNNLGVVSEGYTAMTFRHNGTMRASYTAPDFISDLTGIIQDVDNKEQADIWIEENYGQFDFFRDSKTKRWKNSWLENFFDEGPGGDYPYRRNFQYINILSFMGSDDENAIANVDEKTLLTGLFHAYTCANSADGIDYGYYRCPLFSDVDACVMIKGPRYAKEGYQETIIELLTKVLLQEIDRISDVEASISDPDSTKVENFNDEKRKNGTRLQYFPELNSRLSEIKEICKLQPGETADKYLERRDTALKAIIRDMVAAKVEKFLDTFTDSEKIAIGRKLARNEARQNKKEGEGVGEKIDLTDEGKLSAEQRAKEARDMIERVDKKLTEFFYNDFFAQSQIQQLLGSDLAFYKDYQDYIKRNKQAYACGERLFARETDEHGNIIGNLVETVMYLEDEDVMSSSYEGLRNLLQSSDMTDAEQRVVDFALKQFQKITSTDGQSFRTMDSFKKIFEAMGKWTDDMERAYQNIKQGRITARDFLALWNPIKPFYFGYESIDINGKKAKAPVQHKNSEYMITALFSFLNSALNKSPKLRGLQKFMEDHDIDVVHFHSVVKEGFNSPFDLNYNKEKYDRMLRNGEVTLFGEPFKGSYKEYMSTLMRALHNGEITQEEFNRAKREFDYTSSEEVAAALESQCRDSEGNLKGLMFKQFPMDGYMIVQPSGDHLVDAEAIFGTQLKNIIMADLSEAFSITVNLDGKPHKMNKEEAVKFFNSLLVDNMLDAFSKISDEFSDIHKLHDALFRKMGDDVRYGDDVKAALQINAEGTGFMLPFNSPTLSNKIEALILSTFKDAIQRQKIKGGNSVLVSNFGLHENLKVVYKDGKKENGVDHIEAYLPAAYSCMFKDFLVQKGDYQIIDFEKMREKLGEDGSEELLDIIGYRIPTEDKYSIMPIRIVGFMPITAGASIMLPADIITMSGTDFDIDKLFLMMKEFDRLLFPKSLLRDFNKWLADNKEVASERTMRVLEDVVTDGYTEEEIIHLAEHDEVFNDFMDEVGWGKQYSSPIYKVIKPVTSINGKELSLDEISKQSTIKSSKRRQAIRNNMLIDVIRQTLTTEEVSKLLLQPGNFKRVKHASRQQRILHNPDVLREFMIEYRDEINRKGLFTVLQELDPDKLDEIYNEYALPVDPLNILDYVKMQRNLMDGNALIGMFAVNSSNHYKLQFMPCDIDKDYQFTINGVTFTKVDEQTSPLTGDRIGRINAELQAASPDNGKDPCLGDIGANPRTASRIGLLARLGLEPEYIGVINTSEDFADYGESIDKELKGAKIKLPELRTFNFNMNKLTEMIAIYRTDRKAFDALMSIQENKIFVAMYSKLFSTIKTLAKSLNGVSKVSRSDSVNGSLEVDLPGVLSQYFGTVDFIADASAENSPIKGLDKLVDVTLDATRMSPEELREAIMNAPIPRLQAAYTLGIKSALSLCGGHFPGLSSSAVNGVQFLRSQLQKSLTRESDKIVLRKFLGELTMAILSRNPMFGTTEDYTMESKRNYYIHDFPMKYKAFKEAKGKNGELIHSEVNNLTLIQSITNKDGKGLKFRNVGKITDRSRKHFVEELETLLFSEDPEVTELAQDLLIYSYFDNGLQFGHSNFGIFFTTTYMKNMPKFIESLNEGNASLFNGNFNMRNFVYQFIMNHPNLIPEIKNDKYTISGDKLIPTPKGKESISSGVQKTGDPVMFIATQTEEGRKIWIKNGVGSNLHYVEVEVNKTDIPYYDMSIQFDEIKWSNLKERGHVGNVDPNKKEKEKEQKGKDNSKDKVDPKSAPKEDIDPSDYVPEEEEDKIKDLTPEEEDEPAGLKEMADKISRVESNILELSKKADAIQAKLDAASQEEVPDDLDKYTPTDDPDVTMCE